MGVSTNIYTFYGVKIEWDDDFHEAYDEVYADLQVPVIVDAMMGEYIVCYSILATSAMVWKMVRHTLKPT